VVKRGNNFDLLRLGLAATVLVVHTYELTAWPELAWLSRWLSAPMAMQAFFVVSGYLITMSYERSPSLRDYASRRVRRIYPAYAVVILVCAFGLVFASSLDWRQYFSIDWLKYVGANLVFLNFLHPTLPGVFVGHWGEPVNGALWTLKIEVMFYAFVPVMVWAMRRLNAASVLVTLYVLSLAWIAAAAWMAQRTGSAGWLEVGRQLPGQLGYFVSGTALYVWRDAFARHRLWLAIAALAVMWLPLGLVGVLGPLAIAILAIGFATGPFAGYTASWGDVSYGLYIWHFPVLQCLIDIGWFGLHRQWLLPAAAIVTTVLAFASWRLVERPSLQRRNHYRAADTHAVSPPSPGAATAASLSRVPE
jgi:peptidoglycan/LPS O-acetylase OafA/YrhL